MVIYSIAGLFCEVPKLFPFAKEKKSRGKEPMVCHAVPDITLFVVPCKYFRNAYCYHFTFFKALYQGCQTGPTF